MGIVTKVPPKILRKYLKDDLVLRKVTKTEDTEWGQPDYSTSDYSIKGIVYELILDDLTFLPPGIVKEGDISVVLLPEYAIGASKITPESMDRIVYLGKEFEIRVLSDIVDGNKVLIRSGYAKRL